MNESSGLSKFRNSVIIGPVGSYESGKSIKKLLQKTQD
jgi:hypothetical protein